jgi:hypothetical protein
LRYLRPFLIVQFIEETERSLHDAIMIVRRAIKNDAVVAGGGAIEMEISKFLRSFARTIPGKQQLLISAYAKALEVIPRQLCDNAGLDATNVLNRLRQKHAQGGTWFGVDIFTEDIADNFLATVWEPAVVKINALTAATEAACLLLSVDETVKNPTSNVVCTRPLSLVSNLIFSTFNALYATLTTNHRRRVRRHNMVATPACRRSRLARGQGAAAHRCLADRNMAIMHSY